METSKDPQSHGDVVHTAVCSDFRLSGRTVTIRAHCSEAVSRSCVDRLLDRTSCLSPAGTTQSRNYLHMHFRDVTDQTVSVGWHCLENLSLHHQIWSENRTTKPWTGSSSQNYVSQVFQAAFRGDQLKSWLISVTWRFFILSPLQINCDLKWRLVQEFPQSSWTNQTRVSAYFCPQRADREGAEDLSMMQIRCSAK